MSQTWTNCYSLVNNWLVLTHIPLVTVLAIQDFACGARCDRSRRKAISQDETYIQQVIWAKKYLPRKNEGFRYERNVG
ncbi:hypothetical protein APA_4239 [Pseudanabaena sp. lw0831]|uniref:hypothetical protein n=1 Tax=Pseudanabaena sp. lw0831 TaxID=1357935 RepID=UPI0019162674|nr:hypothetical protein [Pseudanabaena sp. lw0831]GBO56033.1 hypothetical protein APA_4239 [Pseudanabaena sp. lw0831]